MRILFVDDNPEIRELLIFTLRTQTEFSAVEAAGGAEAIDLLSKDETFDYIITDLNMPKGSGLDVHRFVREKKLSCRMIVTSAELPVQLKEDPLLLFLKKPFTFEDLQLLLDELTGHSQSQDPQYYVPVTLKLLRKIGKIDVPLYIRINNQKFVKITTGLTDFNENEYRRYHQRGVNELFVECVLADTLVEEFSKRAFSYDAWAEAGMNDHDHIHINGELVRSICMKLGGSEEQVDEVLNAARRALLVIRTQNKLTQVFHQFQKIEKWGIADHAALVLTVSAGLAHLLGHGDQETLRKLAFAALLHDMNLNDDQYSKKENILSKLGYRTAALPSPQTPSLSKDQRVILDHPAQAAEFCKSLAVCPPGVDQIVLHHHELPNGLGFPLGKRAEELPLMSALFIFAEDFTLAFITSSGRLDLEGYLSSRSSQYKSGYFKIVLEAFRTCTAGQTQIAS